MNKDYFKTKLEKEKERLEKEISYFRSEDPYTNSTRSRGNLDDDITEIEEHDRLNATKVDLESSLRDVEQALQRIEKGTFGKCSNCGDSISEERLEVMPTASLCLTCQQSRVKA
jgi:RNA polymerase-binding protein DksA